MARPKRETSSAAGAGHNSELTPEEAKALKFDHFHKIMAQKARVEAEAAEYQKLRKLAKADKIVLSDIDFMMKCASVEDSSIITERQKRELEIASWFALPVTFQPDMFDDTSREPAVDRARREGRAAGASGVGSNPHDLNSELGRAWAEEWSAEQKRHQAALLSGMEKRNEVAQLVEGAGHDRSAQA